jgi:hypothetical protein
MSIYREQLWYDNSTNTLNSAAKLATKVYKAQSVNTATQSIPNVSWTAVTFPSDTLTNWPARASNSQFVAPTSGTYVVVCNLGYTTPPGTSGVNKGMLALNGLSTGTILAEQTFPYATGIPQFTLTALVTMNGTTDYLTAYLYQASGGAVLSGGTNSDIPAANYYNNIVIYRIGS